MNEIKRKQIDMKDIVIKTVTGTSQELCIVCSTRFVVKPPKAYVVKDSYFPQYICKQCVKKTGVSL